MQREECINMDLKRHSFPWWCPWLCVTACNGCCMWSIYYSAHQISQFNGLRKSGEGTQCKNQRCLLRECLYRCFTINPLKPWIINLLYLLLHCMLLMSSSVVVWPAYVRQRNNSIFFWWVCWHGFARCMKQTNSRTADLPKTPAEFLLWSFFWNTSSCISLTQCVWYCLH